MKKRNFSEDGFKRMMEAARRGNQTQKEQTKKRKEAYLNNPRHCPECDGIISYERRTNKFCSASCGAKHANRLRKKTKLCKQCNKELSTGSVYCSQKCHKDYVKSNKIEKWLSGEIDVSTVLGCSLTIKKYLLEQCNHKCPKCGWDKIHPVTGKVPLEVNHIDGDSTNNRPENLEILCPNCHSLTSNYRALNKKSSRSHR
jgi:predicted nucleic acid-binding Zn ribbon protein